MTKLDNNPFTPVERVESLKTAIAGGTLAGVLSICLLLGNYLVHPEAGLYLNWAIPRLLSSLLGQTLLIRIGIAAVSGALFALTYRYAIRQDPNPQLKIGVVLAFTLVRGLAKVDAASAIAQHYWPFAVVLIKSGLLFGGCAVGLNLAIQRQWLKPFGASQP